MTRTGQPDATPPRFGRARIARYVALGALAVAAVVTGLWPVWLATMNHDRQAGAVLRQSTLPAALLVLVLLVAARHVRRWMQPVRRLTRVLTEIRAGGAACEDLNDPRNLSPEWRGAGPSGAGPVPRPQVGARDGPPAGGGDEAARRDADRHARAADRDVAPQGQPRLPDRPLQPWRVRPRLPGTRRKGPPRGERPVRGNDRRRLLQAAERHARPRRRRRPAPQDRPSSSAARCARRTRRFATAATSSCCCFGTPARPAARATSDRLSRLVEDLCKPFGLPNAPRLSCGVCNLGDRPTEAPTDLLKRADDDLYRLKKSTQIRPRGVSVR